MELSQCKICHSFDTKTVMLNEKMYGTEKTFKYIICSVCGCLQLAESIENMSEYYPSDYYSFTNQHSLFSKIKSYAENHILKYVALQAMGSHNIIGKIAAYFKEYYEYYFVWLGKLKASKKSMILDVGCGSGILLERLSLLGFNNLYGIDPFIEKDIITPKYKIWKKNLSDLTEKYDIIMLHHAFEHMQDPHEVMEYLKEHLNPHGTILIRIPMVDSYAFKEYGTNWFQLDAPRHLFLHSRKSMECLVNAHELQIENVIYDSTSKQFLYSERYKHGYGLQDTRFNFSSKKSKDLRNRAKRLNESAQGEQACFFIRKSND